MKVFLVAQYVNMTTKVYQKSLLNTSLEGKKRMNFQDFKHDTNLFWLDGQCRNQHFRYSDSYSQIKSIALKRESVL